MNSNRYRAWVLAEMGGPLRLEERNVPAPRPDGVVVRIERATVLSYMTKVIDGCIPYALPPLPFIPGTNAIGTVEATGQDVTHVSTGERVFLSPHLVDNTSGGDPSQILIGLTAMGSSRFGNIPEGSRRLQRNWPDGVFAEVAHWPASCVTSLRGLDEYPADALVSLAKMVVPYGGWLKAGLNSGDAVIVNGASGYYGSAAVLVALALGASRIIAAGRDEAALKRLAETLGARVLPAALTGDPGTDSAKLHDLLGGSAHRALDLLGQADSTSTTLSILRSLRRGGRLVLMGSATVPLELSFGEMLSNDWEIAGCFMYPKQAPAQLARLVSSGLLDLSKVRPQSFSFEDLPEAIRMAAGMRDLDCVIVSMQDR